MRLAYFGISLLGLPALALACSSSSAVTAPETGGTGGVGNTGGAGGAGGSGGTGGVPAGHGVGESCTDTDPCRPGLACNSGVCEPGGETPEGSPCVIAGECQDGLQCVAGVCAPAGSGGEGSDCQSDGDCETGLRCDLVGFAAQCVPQGNVDAGGECSASRDCFAGLACISGQCAPVPPGAPPFGLPASPNIECDEPSEGSVRAYFEVPGANPAGQEKDFFRLPFPNDARLKSGKPDLTGFPTPGVSLLPFDPVQVYIDEVEKEDGWGANPVVTFRFSGPVDFESFREPTDHSVRPVRWVDVTPGDPSYGAQAGLRWYYSEGGGKYVCRDWFAIRRSASSPLEPGHTYAVFLTTDGRAKNGTQIERAEHLQAMLSATAPSDSVLAAAHAAYAPFRDYLTGENIDPGSVLNASVITVGDTRAPMEQLAAAVEAAPVPTSQGWVKCADGVESPCPDHTGDRACGSGDAAYDEYHALVSLPIFQQGDAPYLASGGAIQTSGPVRNEDVCMALTVPKGATMPSGGWPLVVFAHGTGGSFRSHVRPEVAGALAAAATPGGNVPVAVLGIDQVSHGPRRNGSTESPNNLFFNFANPAAARGNPMQGAADQIALGRFAASLDLTAAQTGGDAIKIDPTAIAFFGHSQGSTEGSLGVPYSHVYRAAVFSGNGAILRDALISKRKPVNIAGAIPLVLGDYDSQFQLPGGTNHPVMNLLQQFIEPADPINYGVLIGRKPISGVTPKHLFVTYGLGDTYSPNATIANYILASQVDLAAHDASVATPDDLGLMEQAVPLSLTDVVDSTDLTLGARQYMPPAGTDGHFVVFDVAAANADAVRFLGMAVSGSVPQIGQ
ncbi:MAG: hypothetical protein R3B89_24525 [Polyangiaceae bacterium]